MFGGRSSTGREISTPSLPRRFRSSCWTGSGGCGGVETFCATQAIRPNVRVLVSSGYSEQEAINRFKGEAPLGFIQKPYRAGELLLKIEEIGARASPGASIEA